MLWRTPGCSKRVCAAQLIWTNAPNAGPTSGEHQDHLGNTGFVTDCSACHPLKIGEDQNAPSRQELLDTGEPQTAAAEVLGG